jgi:hypothetical protein
VAAGDRPGPRRLSEQRLSREPDRGRYPQCRRSPPGVAAASHWRQSAHGKSRPARDVWGGHGDDDPRPRARASHCGHARAVRAVTERCVGNSTAAPRIAGRPDSQRRHVDCLGPNALRYGAANASGRQGARRRPAVRAARLAAGRARWLAVRGVGAGWHLHVAQQMATLVGSTSWPGGSFLGAHWRRQQCPRRVPCRRYHRCRLPGLWLALVRAVSVARLRGRAHPAAGSRQLRGFRADLSGAGRQLRGQVMASTDEHANSGRLSTARAPRVLRPCVWHLLGCDSVARRADGHTWHRLRLPDAGPRLCSWQCCSARASPAWV